MLFFNTIFSAGLFNDNIIGTTNLEVEITPIISKSICYKNE